MQLNIMNSNVISKALGKNSYNILYEPKFNLIDNILFELKYKFYIFGNNTFDFATTNVINLPERLYGTYNYSMHVSYNIEKYADDGHVSKIFHIPSIIIIDNNIRSYKKEDKFILNQKVKNCHKIFLDPKIHEYFGKPNKSYIVPLGIPLETFISIKEFNTRNKDVVIINDDIVAQQIKQNLEKNNISCDIVDIKFQNSQTINTIFNRYKFCIDTTNNNYMNLLCAIASGCKALTTSPMSLDCPYITHLDDIDVMINIIRDTNNIENYYNTVRDYLKNNFCYEEFTNKMSDIFSIVSREVFIQ